MLEKLQVPRRETICTLGRPTNSANLATIIQRQGQVVLITSVLEPLAILQNFVVDVIFHTHVFRATLHENNKGFVRAKEFLPSVQRSDEESHDHQIPSRLPISVHTQRPVDGA